MDMIFYTVRGLAERWRVSQSTIYRWHRERKMPVGLRLPNGVLVFPSPWIDDFEEASIIPTAPHSIKYAFMIDPGDKWELPCDPE